MFSGSIQRDNWDETMKWVNSFMTASRHERINGDISMF